MTPQIMPPTLLLCSKVFFESKVGIWIHYIVLRLYMLHDKVFGIILGSISLWYTFASKWAFKISMVWKTNNMYITRWNHHGDKYTQVIFSAISETKHVLMMIHETFPACHFVFKGIMILQYLYGPLISADKTNIYGWNQNIKTPWVHIHKHPL